MMITGIDYECRVCRHPVTVYARVYEGPDGDLWVDGQTCRLYFGDCQECGQERPHVATVGDVDAARDPAPIDRGLPEGVA